MKLLLDAKEPNRIAGAVGFSTRENKVFVFKSNTILVACGGAVNVYRPRSTGEGMGRAWYPVWNAGSTYTMPATWKQVASADPKRFEALQHEFIRTYSYTPAVKSIALTTGVDVTNRSYALREVLWSTAVQHALEAIQLICSNIEAATTEGRKIETMAVARAASGEADHSRIFLAQYIRI